MNELEMKDRTKSFALRVIRLVNSLSADRASDVIGRQLLRSGTSVGANYRAVCRAKSTADFINKLTIVEEESDESAYWMELLLDSGTVPPRRLQPLIIEAGELTAIVVAAARTTRRKR